MSSPGKADLAQLQPNAVATPAPLLYYDPELQNTSNADPFDAERFQRAGDKAKQLNSAYQQQIAGLAGRISKKTFSLFSDPKFPLFDADLFEFSIGDALGYLASPKRRALASTVKATFGSFDGSRLHVLAYSNIAAMSMNVPSNRWFDSPGKSRIDSLLANELTAVDDTFLQHVFLFVSGTSISIQFERVKWETKRIDRASGADPGGSPLRGRR